jgi:hypothetical protein
LTRPVYPLELTINERKLSRVVIDQHYRQKHREINDELILDLIKTIDGETYPIEKEIGPYQYFVVEPIFLYDKPYRLIFFLCLFDNYLGVINTFRIRKKL